MKYCNWHLFDRLFTLYWFGPWARVKNRIRNSVPILMYHSISSSEADCSRHPYYQLATTPDIFAAQMKYLSENRYVSLDLDEVAAHLQENAHTIPKKSVAITFDDGFQDFSAMAAPILQRYRFKATVFLPTGFIGEKRHAFKGRPCLTWSEVRSLQRQGITFGSHSVQHGKLHTLSRKDLYRELTLSRESIEQNTGVKISGFSYPFAFPEGNNDFRRYLIGALEESGYSHGVTTRIGLAGYGEDKYLMRRIPINSHDDLRMLEAKLVGGYDWLYPIQRAVKSLGPKVYSPSVSEGRPAGEVTG